MLTFKQLENLLKINQNDLYFKECLNNACFSHKKSKDKTTRIRCYIFEDLVYGFCDDCISDRLERGFRLLNEKEIFVLKILVDNN